MKMELSERIMLPERVRIPVLGGIWYRYLCKKKREEIQNVPIQSLSPVSYTHLVLIKLIIVTLIVTQERHSNDSSKNSQCILCNQ